ncbi:MAG: DUF1292 domain-containing protein [Bacilli bacterium]|nr:DUF1292 domain-containing protein [Bacilli bacterium]
MNNKTISTTLPNGTKVTYNVILTFKSILTGKDYVVYTDNTYDNNKKLRVYAARYNPEYINPFIEEPSTKEEWTEITRVIDSVIPAK